MAANETLTSARLAYIEYPAEVDDLIAERHPDEVLSFAAAAGYAIVASSHLERAYLFSIPAGSAVDAIPIPLPSRPRSNVASSPNPDSNSISMTMWLAERTTSSTAKALGIAILSSDGVLRIYPHVLVEDDPVSFSALPTSNQSTNFPCLEIQVDNALSKSVVDASSDETSCQALYISSFERRTDGKDDDDNEQHTLPSKSNTELIVFGSRGSAAHVIFSSTDSAVFPLPRDERLRQSLNRPSDRSSLRLGSLFYSAIRSIGAGFSGRDNHWEFGTGPYEIVDSHPLDNGVILVRRGGEVERWSTSHMLWSFNALNTSASTTTPSSTSQSDLFSNSVISSAATSDGTLVLLTQSTSARGTPYSQSPNNQVAFDCQFQCYDVRSVDAAPDTCHMSISVDSATASESAVLDIVVCSDIVFLLNPQRGRLAWRSVARGIPTEGQVQGSLDVTPFSEVLYLADASRGLHASSTSGVAACLHQDGIMLSCFEVPAPVSEDMLALPSSERVIFAESLSLLWRSFLQYSANQKGAARASLQGLVNIFVSKGYDTSEALSQLVALLSRDIITKDKDAFQLHSNPSNLSEGSTQYQPKRKPFLIDSELVRKSKAHHDFLKMLADIELFTQVRPDAPSIAQDQIWDALDITSRYSVMTDNEMLAAAYAIRQVENAESIRDQTGGFNEAAATNHLSAATMTTTTPANPNSNLKSGKVVEIARALRASLICDNAELRDSLNTVNMALVRVGEQFRQAESRQRGNNPASPTADLPNVPFRNCFEFYKFLPALDVVLTQTLQRLSYDHNVPDDDDENIENQSVYLNGARSAVSLSCEAAVAFVESAMEARDEGSAVLSKGLVGLDGMRSWLLETNDCISALQSIGRQSMMIGLKSTGRERESIMGLATLVVDKLLASARQGGGELDRHQNDRDQPRSTRSKSRSTQGSRSNQQKQVKRRRLELRDVNSEWRRLLKSCMKLLRDHELDDEAFRLAEKYGDYDTMMALKVTADDFNPFMERSISIFGQDFAKFAFQWLEERGHIELLLRGRSEVGDDGLVKRSYCEDEPIKGMLSDYFNQDGSDSVNGTKSAGATGHNLSWMHWLAIGDVERGSRAIEAQLKACAKPNKENSHGNTLFLSSITKLAALCAREENDDVDDYGRSTVNIVDEENRRRFDLASAHLILLRSQDALFDDGKLHDGTETIRGIIDSCEPTSEQLASCVESAMEAVQCCEVIEDEGWGQTDYVWRRCIERQTGNWLTFAQSAYGWTDVELRENLRRTALYGAARACKLTEQQLDEMLARGILDGSDVEQSGALEQVCELVKTTVSLANNVNEVEVYGGGDDEMVN